MGIEQSRRDDIESIGYVIMYLLRGILPWQNMKAKDTKTKYKMIMEKKISTPAEVLCKGYPQELAGFINYARNLKFEDKPDYAYLKNLLKSAMKSNNIEMDFVYDWSKKMRRKLKKKNFLKKTLLKTQLWLHLKKSNKNFKRKRRRLKNKGFWQAQTKIKTPQSLKIRLLLLPIP